MRANTFRASLCSNKNNNSMSDNFSFLSHFSDQIFLACRQPKSSCHRNENFEREKQRRLPGKRKSKRFGKLHGRPRCRRDKIESEIGLGTSARRSETRSRFPVNVAGIVGQESSRFHRQIDFQDWEVERDEIEEARIWGTGEIGFGYLTF